MHTLPWPGYQTNRSAGWQHSYDGGTFHSRPGTPGTRTRVDGGQCGHPVGPGSYSLSTSVLQHCKGKLKFNH